MEGGAGERDGGPSPLRGCASISHTFCSGTAFNFVIALICSAFLTLFCQMVVEIRFGHVYSGNDEYGTVRNVINSEVSYTNYTENTSPENPLMIGSSVKPHLILTWTEYSVGYNWFSKAVDSSDLMDICFQKQILRENQVCEFTTDRSRVKEADALIFRLRSTRRGDLPHIRLKRQQYLVHEFEPPHKTWRFMNLTKYNKFFNLTSTYTWDSDIPTNEHRKFVLSQKRLQENKDFDFAALKRADVAVAWFVSRCPTQSKREEYVAKMQQFIKVDVYGQCGNLTCDYKSKAGFKGDECVKRLLNDEGSYKFYLAFENSLCEDYITEKIWKVIEARIIPVVMGGVDYKQIFPPMTFIDVRDYDSPEELAKYLNFLNENDDEYNKYLRAKDAMIMTSNVFIPRQCLFCKGLLEARNHRSTVFALDEFWGSNRCLSPETFQKLRDPSDFGLNLRDIKSSKMTQPKNDSVV